MCLMYSSSMFSFVQASDLVSQTANVTNSSVAGVYQAQWSTKTAGLNEYIVLLSVKSHLKAGIRMLCV
jgi:hypothetical protein